MELFRNFLKRTFIIDEGHFIQFDRNQVERLWIKQGRLINKHKNLNQKCRINKLESFTRIYPVFVYNI